MRRLAWRAWLVVAWLAPSGALPAAPLDDRLAAALAEEELTGIVYSTVSIGEDGTPIIRTGAAGVANAVTGDAMRADARVNVGSVAKTLVALGVLRLVTQGRLTLDAPVAELVPQVAIENPWPASPVRVRHLIDHTSGLEDARLWQVFGTVSPDAPLIDAFDPARVTLRLRTEPGTTFSYSNMSYALAGLVIEAVTRERYEPWLDANLLAPLGMKDSTFAFVRAGADARLASGHYDDRSLAPPAANAVRPSGQFTTTAEDMGRLAVFLLARGARSKLDSGSAEALIDAALLDAMGRPTNTDAARAGLAVGASLGLIRRDRHGVVADCHGGSVVGFRALFCMFPDARRAFFTSINTDSETADYNRFDALMVDALDMRDDRRFKRDAGYGAQPTAPPVDVTPWLGRYIPSPGRFETFRYLDVLGASFVLAAANGGDARDVEIRAMGADPKRLRAPGGALLQLADRVTPSHVLLHGATHAGPDARLISDGMRTHGRVSGAWYTAIWVGFVLGVAGLAWFALVAPLRGAFAKERVLQPGTVGAWLLLLPLPFLATQSFVALGDFTIGSALLYAVLALLPIAMLVQLVWSWRRQAAARWWRAHAIAALAVLQWCATLYAYDLLPLALWR